MNAVFLLGCHFSPRRVQKIGTSPETGTDMYARDYSAKEIEDEASLARLEDAYLGRTRRLINKQNLGATAAVGVGASLEAVDKSLEFCMALSLLARYCFYTNRFDQGVCYTNCEHSHSYPFHSFYSSFVTDHSISFSFLLDVLNVTLCSVYVSQLQ